MNASSVASMGPVTASASFAAGTSEDVGLEVGVSGLLGPRAEGLALSTEVSRLLVFGLRVLGFRV